MLRPAVLPSHTVSRASTQPAFDLIVLAASTGGVVALRTVLATLPATFPVALAVVQHRTPESPNLLATLLGRATRLTVKLARAGETLAASTVYVAPPHRYMTIAAGRRVALAGGPINFVRSSADPLFESAGRAFGSRVIAVVLSGYDGDGLTGARTLKALGGIVVAEDPATAETPDVQHAAALPASAVDFLLPLAEIGPALVRLVTTGM